MASDRCQSRYFIAGSLAGSGWSVATSPCFFSWQPMMQIARSAAAIPLRIENMVGVPLEAFFVHLEQPAVLIRAGVVHVDFIPERVFECRILPLTNTGWLSGRGFV